MSRPTDEEILDVLADAFSQHQLAFEELEAYMNGNKKWAREYHARAVKTQNAIHAMIDRLSDVVYNQ